MREPRKNRQSYYRAYPRDFFEGTIGMRLELKAAYRLVIDLIHMTGGQLPDEPRYIAAHLGCSVRKWAKLSYARIWVTRPDQAARVSVSRVATPSVNVTPSMT